MSTSILALIFGLASSFNVWLGSFITLRLEKHFNIILGVAGGAMIGTVAFEVLPEIVEMLHVFDDEWSVKSVGIFFMVGVMLLHFLSKILPLHEHGQHDHDSHNHHTHLHTSSRLGIYGAVVMIAHAFIDGFGIGVGFMTSVSLGLTMALAVLLHNISDGVNTSTTLLLNNIKGSRFKIIMSLSILAPLLGVLASFIFNVSDKFVLYYLSFFAGSILYLAISEILPHAHSHSKNKSPILGTIFGVTIIFIASLIFTH